MRAMVGSIGYFRILLKIVLGGGNTDQSDKPSELLVRVRFLPATKMGNRFTGNRLDAVAADLWSVKSPIENDSSGTCRPGFSLH